MGPHPGKKVGLAREGERGCQLAQGEELLERERTADELELGRAVVEGLQELHWVGPCCVEVISGCAGGCGSIAWRAPTGPGLQPLAGDPVGLGPQGIVQAFE